MSITLNILDQSLVGEEEQAEQAIQNTVRLAQAAEKLGYHRFWVSEHHNSRDVAGSAPEALIGYLLARTNTLKIGSGGVMLQHYSPYKVAEIFHVLASLAPGRVDLGVGKAPGGLNVSTQALQEDLKPAHKDFTQKLLDLKAYVNREEQTEKLEATPVPSSAPEMFLLGGSAESAELAAKQGISFVFAYFINGDNVVLQEAREAFEKHSPKGAKHKFLLALTVAVAEDEEKALSYIKQKESVKITFSDGRKLNVGSINDAKELVKDADKADYFIKIQKAGYLAGTKETVSKNLHALSRTYDIDEVIVLSPIADIEQRIAMFTSLKEALDTDDNYNQKFTGEVRI
ncbi:LLM class flavin-dependent oxidoreductase [Terribacillus sp. DMT04]|uniref:LLM class flavin-dependent oxidoreductase n=1 Tax=Terribacillus sp. DMT04 TaxID=2850441 RepID=UPI001C2BA23B|nr:LLM class flavin-dependent oxidoreductase [Terribacillus sp. DMT04]QXE03258.1 LLM class flavin-dependent oxidoreductase [Terribacillus sp. DMT04]